MKDLVVSILRSIANKIENYEKDRGESDVIPNLPLRDYLVVIDAGHGGTDPGAVGPHGLKESDVVLNIGLYTKKILENLGCECILTRSANVTVQSRERPQVAVQQLADLFLSIHCNANDSQSVSGMEVYFHGDNYQEYGYPPAYYIMDSMTSKIDRKSNGVKSDFGIYEHRGFLVLREAVKASVPAVLVECDYISNPYVEEYLGFARSQEEMATAIATGVRNYLESEGKLSHDAYMVKSGDNLWAIANNYNVPMTKLAETNNLGEPYWISTGQILKIPQREEE